jgi:hypothetical protein
MPVEKVPGGYRWGKTGKVYKRRINAVKQGEAIQAKKSSTGYSKGGTTSKVNEAGNYTQPGMRKSLFNSIKAGGKGGKPGQWSARKAQMLAKQYKAKGGGYKS